MLENFYYKKYNNNENKTFLKPNEVTKKKV